MASYVWGRDADRFDGLSQVKYNVHKFITVFLNKDNKNQDEVIRICLEDVAKIHNRDVRFLKSVFRQGLVKSWANDEFTLGAFAFFTPYQVVKIEEKNRNLLYYLYFVFESILNSTSLSGHLKVTSFLLENTPHHPMVGSTQL